MGRPPSTHEDQVKKGPWTPEEDQMLIDYINEHGDHGKWRGLPKLAGLNRCGKSCRLRWNNYLKPHIKRGKFSEEEEELIISLHSNLGNKWSQIASHLPGRTDNEIKNYWNTRLKKKLLQIGIDPVTHTQRTDLDLLSDLNHLLMSGSNTMNPWDSAIQLQAQLAQIQLLQNLAQLIHMGTAPSQDYRRNEYHLQSGVQFQQLHNMQSFAQTSNISNSYDTFGEFSNNDNRKYQSSNSNSAASTNTTISTTVSGSPESSFVNEIDGKVDPSDISSNYSFEAWGDFNLDDTFWKDILE